LFAALALGERLAEDMSLRWRRGRPRRTEDYLHEHPELLDVPEAALELLAEEIFLAQEHGEELTLADLVRRFPTWQGQVRALLDCQQTLSAGLAPRFPTPGQSLGEFDLLAEIGRGAHARVFLARQPALAGRLVVLKLGPRASREHLSLARLQHTWIVPLYSAHDFPTLGLHALCLPYFGGATLDRLLQALAPRPASQRTGRDLLDALRCLQAEAPASVPVEGPACRFLARASWTQAVCWLGACLADALAHAGGHGLVHLDLKPSNVLLSADGQPMLLDFHLARGPLAAGAAAPPWLGGTPGYMAPEHRAALQAVVDGTPLPLAVDGRADVYALGLVLCELLGGKCESGGDPVALASRADPAIPRSLADLLRRCLAPDPAKRYPTAADLASDLRRHLADLPLRGVGNRSLVERWGKWRRRRPAALPLLLLVLLLLAGAGALSVHVSRQRDRAQAALLEGRDHLAHHRYPEALEAFRHGATLAADLPGCESLRRRINDGLYQAERGEAAGDLHRFCETVRPLYAVEHLPLPQARKAAERCRALWGKREQIHRCLEEQSDPALAAQVRADLLDLAVLWSHLLGRLAPAQQADARREALAVLDQAEELLGSSCVLYQERRTHAAALGWNHLADKSARKAFALPPRSAWEHYALGRAWFLAGDLEAALREMDLALARNPGALWPTFYKGCCSYRLGRCDDAVVAFSVCLALAPDSPWCSYNRGLAYVEMGRLDRALLDFDRALRLDPSFAAAALSRGLLHYRLGHYTEALDDLLRARRAGLDGAAVHCGLALVHLARRNREQALECARIALRIDPERAQAREVLRQLGQDR
jgi:serine/threonine protein kinase/Flp pilus assembly protein TadD